MIVMHEIYDNLKDSTEKTRNEMLDKMLNSNSFNLQKVSVEEVFYKMIKQGIDTSKTEEMFDLIHEIGSNEKYLVKFLNEIPKKEFDKIWERKKKNGRILIMYQSTNVDSEQLEYLWNKYVKGTEHNISDLSHKLKKFILSHPKAPEYILEKRLKDKNDLAEIASNPSIPKKVKDYLTEKFNKDKFNPHYYRDIFFNLLENESLDWKEISDITDMRSKVKKLYGKKSLSLADSMYPSGYRRTIENFFLRDDTPEKARESMYKLTNDDRFLPDEIKNIFLF